MERGNTLIISSIFIAIFLIILFFSACIFMSHVNSVLYNFKLDFYSIARSGVIAVNKNKANTGNLTYDEKTYKKEIEKALKQNYMLDESMSNKDKLISKIRIKDFKIFKANQRDTFTKERCDDATLHVLLDVSIRPIIFRDYLEKIFTFEIHEDVNLNPLKM